MNNLLGLFIGAQNFYTFEYPRQVLKGPIFNFNEGGPYNYITPFKIKIRGLLDFVVLFNQLVNCLL